jgi:hypothetical protein
MLSQNFQIDYFTAFDAPRQVTLLPELLPYWQRYTDPAYQDAMTPLIIECEVDSPLGGYHPLTLDGLLAWSVVNEAMNGNQLDNSQSPYLLPVPLHMMWRSPSGMPLWATNWFGPVGANRKVSLWWHKRAIKPEYAALRKGVKSSIHEQAGRFKEKRIPMPAQIASTWTTTCIGNADEIARLLQPVDAVGKKRNARVSQWTIRQAEAFSFSRPVPAAYIHEREKAFPLDVQLAAWTPPYWDSVPECKALCAI